MKPSKTWPPGVLLSSVPQLCHQGCELMGKSDEIPQWTSCRAKMPDCNQHSFRTRKVCKYGALLSYFSDLINPRTLSFLFKVLAGVSLFINTRRDLLEFRFVSSVTQSVKVNSMVLLWELSTHWDASNWTFSNFHLPPTDQEWQRILHFNLLN